MLGFCRPSYIRLWLVSFMLAEMESRYVLLKSEGKGLLIPNGISLGEVAKDQMADSLSSWNDISLALRRKLWNMDGGVGDKSVLYRRWTA